MIANNIELYNVTELRPTGRGGQLLCRIPSDLRKGLNLTAQRTGLCCCGVELRFCLKGESAKIVLDLENGDELPPDERYIGEVYYGCFQGPPITIGRKQREISIRYPEQMELLQSLTRQYSLPFHPEVVRVILPYAAHVSLVAVEGDVCPPQDGQLPKQKLMIHGSSLTHGSNGVGPATTYAMRTAAKLGVDLINLGMAGGAELEPCMADYLAGRQDWDYGLLELGINFAWDFTNSRPRKTEDFRRAVDYFIPTVANAHPDKWLFCVGYYPYIDDFRHNEASVMNDYREIVRAKVQSLNLPKLVYLPGEEMMPGGVTGISADMVHPSLAGALDISDYLAGAIGRYISQTK